MASSLRAGKAVRAAGVALLSILALLSVILVAEQSSASRNRAMVEAHRAAQVVATQFGWMFEASANTLRRMEDAPRNGPGADGGGRQVRKVDPAFEVRAVEKPDIEAQPLSALRVSVPIGHGFDRKHPPIVRKTGAGGTPRRLCVVERAWLQARQGSDHA